MRDLAKRPRSTPNLRHRGVVAASLAGLALVTAGCGNASNPHAVNVLYAGSLVDLMTNQIGPGFHKATGDTVTGYSAGSTDLVTQIKGKVHRGDVFISASPAADASLEGSANGNWESWYASFATSGLVLGYNPNSKFAAALKSEPWYQVITKPGFRLGMTDPSTDPKGELAVQALTETAQSKGIPALTRLSTNTADYFPEETLVGRLQAGQLDAGFFYTSEAKAADIATVPLTGTDLKATYTVSILAGAPHETAAEAFVKYLLGPAGQAVLRADGYTVISPVQVSGTGVPATLSSVIP